MTVKEQPKIEELLHLKKSLRGTSIRWFILMDLPEPHRDMTGLENDARLEVSPYTLGRIRSAWRRICADTLALAPAASSAGPYGNFMKECYWEERGYQRFLLSAAAKRYLMRQAHPA